MANITKYETANGRRYRVRYRMPDGTQTDKRGFKTKAEANAWASQTDVAMMRGEFISESAGRITIDELWPRWLATKQNCKESYLRTVTIGWETHVKPKWGHVAVKNITTAQVAEWVHGIKRSPSVSRRAHGILAGILDLAVDDQRAARNVARGIKLPKRRSRKNTYLTLTQVAMLAVESKAHAPLVWFLATTGLRWGEAVALDGKHLDREAGTVLVERTATMVGSKLVFSAPKTDEARDVPVASLIAGMIPDTEPGAPLFPGPRYGRRRTYAPGKESWLEYAVARCQTADRRFPSITVHDLRHTAASLAVSAGANVKLVQRMLGHSSAAMTLDVYAELWADDLSVVADAIDAKIVSECGQNVGKPAP